jgi:hypothetical protein
MADQNDAVKNIVRTSGYSPKLVAQTVRYPIELEREIDAILEENPALKKSVLLRHCLSVGFSITCERLGRDTP